jgi:hypothetical protein
MLANTSKAGDGQWDPFKILCKRIATTNLCQNQHMDAYVFVFVVLVLLGCTISTSPDSGYADYPCRIPNL